jgi:hypothetical protein
MSESGQVSLVDASSGLPANVVWLSGLPISNDRVCISNKPVSVVSSGIPYDSAGAVAATVAPITTNATLDLVFAGVSNDLLNPTSYTLTTDFITPQYQVGAQYTVWDNGLVQKNFADIVTFTRASTATYFNSAGTLTSAAVDEARFDYNPSTLAAQGLLIEEARTNLLTYSEQFDNASGWTSARASVSANATTAPTGTTVADKIVEDTTASNTHLTFSANVSVATATVYTYSVYAKASGRTWFNMQIETGTGAYGATVPFCYFNLSGAGSVGTSTAATGSITSVGNGWYRCVLVATATTAASTTNMRIKLATGDGAESYTGDGTSGIFVFGAQLEAGAFHTSYIPTTTTALTRAADVASVNTLSPWYNSVAGTLYAEWVARLGVDQQPFGLVNVADGVRIRKNAANNYGFVVREPTVRDLALVPSPALTEGQIIKVAGAYAANDIALSGGGQSPVAGPTYSVVTATTAFIGGSVSTGAPYVNGHLLRITYYPRRLSNAELQTITA